MNKLLLIASFAVLAIDANKIRKIEMQTSDEPDSGMNHLFGQVTLDICRSPGNCCSTNVLDNPFEDNFQDGGFDVFSDVSVLGECADFEFGNPQPFEGMMILKHEGTDGYKGRYSKIYTDDNTDFKCYYVAFLDLEDSEAGQDCSIE